MASLRNASGYRRLVRGGRCLLLVALLAVLLSVVLAAPAQGQPSITSLAPGDTRVGVSWTDGDVDGSWFVEFGTHPNGALSTQLAGSGSLTASPRSNMGHVAQPHVVGGLRNGVVYRFRVCNLEEECSSWSTATPVAPANAAPLPPTNLQATAGDGHLALTWTAPDSHGREDITAYQVRHKSWSGTWSADGSCMNGKDTGSTATTYTLSGLDNGDIYVVQVRARNTNGDSPWSKHVGKEVEGASRTVTTTATTTPTATTTTTIARSGLPPRNVRIPVKGPQTLTVVWDVPTDPTGLTGYEVEHKLASAANWMSAGSTARDTLHHRADRRHFVRRPRAG